MFISVPAILPLYLPQSRYTPPSGFGTNELGRVNGLACSRWEWGAAFEERKVEVAPLGEEREREKSSSEGQF